MTEGTINDTKIDFVQLCTSFIEYYTKFDQEFGTRRRDQECYVTFGISGAGKSTTLARLKSEMRPLQFWEKINNRSGHTEEVEIEDITIGHTVNSTTVVPRIYQVGTKFLCDMPGFAETNVPKRICIDILQKIFLSRVPNSTLLIVADIDLINDAKCERLLQHYHHALKDLLADQYENSIEHFYFVLTKNHVNSYSSDHVRTELFSKAMEMMDSDMSFSKFLRRMARHHTLVDLQTDDNKSLFEKFEDMIDKDVQRKKGRDQVTNFRIMKLQASENTLNRLAIKNLEGFRQSSFAFKEQFNGLTVALENLKDSITKETEAIKVEREKAIKSLKEIKKKQQKNAKDLEMHLPKRDGLVREIKDMDIKLSVREKQEELFEDHFQTAAFVTYRCDVATPSKGVGGRKFALEMSADVSSDDSAERFILIMDYETADKTLRQYIGRGNLLIPKKLADLKNINLASVLYNSHQNIIKCKAEIKRTEEPGILKMKVSHTKRFKLFIYSSTPFSKLSYYEDLRDSMKDAIQKDKKRLQRLKQSVKELDKENQGNVQKQIQLQEDLAVAKERIGSIMDNASSSRAVHQKRCMEFIATAEQMEKDIQTVKQDPCFKLIAQVDNIFLKNSLEANLSEILAETHNAFSPIERDARFMIDAVKRFDETDEKMLENVRKVDFEDEEEDDRAGYP